MTVTAAEEYREHRVWAMLESRTAEVASMKFQSPSAEAARGRVLEVLRYAQRSKANVSRALLNLGALDKLQDSLNRQIPSDDHNFEHGYYRSNPYAELTTAIRALPGPLPKGMKDSYIEALDAAAAARRAELADLTQEAQQLKSEIAAERKQLESLRKSIEASEQANKDSRSRISQTAQDAQTNLQAEWASKLAEWEVERDRKDDEIDRHIDEKLGLLAYSAQAAERLVEYAAGRFTARDWADRATRERRLGYRMRGGAIGAFISAGVVGGALVLEAIQRDHGLDLGGSLLRVFVVGAITALGFYLSRESRRHLDEADSAEEVAAVLQALEPYYASADGEVRTGARSSVGEMLFVRNIQSRFAARDASKHNGMDNQQLNELIETLTKSADLARKSSSS